MKQLISRFWKSSKIKTESWWKRTKAKDQVMIYAILLILSRLSFAFLGPTYSLFLHGNGMSEAQMTTINTVYMLSVFAMEVPTGVIADAFGRKISTVIGWGIQAIGFFLYSQSSGFTSFAISEFTVAIGTACVSGAFTSWLRENINGERYTKITSRTEIISKAISIALNTIAGVVAVRYGYRIIWIIGGLFLAVTAASGLLLMKKDSPSKRQESEKKGLERVILVLRDSKNTLANSRTLRLLLVTSFITTASFQALNMFWALKFTVALGLEDISGLLFSGISLTALAGTWISQSKFMIGKNPNKSMICVNAITALGIILSAITRNPWISLSMFYLHEIGRGAARITQDSYIQNHLVESARSALSSLSSMSSTLGAAFGLTIAGQLATHASIEVAWIVSAIMLSMTIVIYFYISKKERL